MYIRVLTPVRVSWRAGLEFDSQLRKPAGRFVQVSAGQVGAVNSPCAPPCVAPVAWAVELKALRPCHGWNGMLLRFAVVGILDLAGSRIPAPFQPRERWRVGARHNRYVSFPCVLVRLRLCNCMCVCVCRMARPSPDDVCR